MPRKKKPRGRPARPLPPRIDATAEEIAEKVLQVKPKGRFSDPPAQIEYKCGKCTRLVAYPETLYRGGLCRECHDAVLRNDGYIQGED